jgi:hypothetical protein
MHRFDMPELRRLPLVSTLTFLALGACAGNARELRQVPDPELAATTTQKREADADRRSLERGLLQIELALDSYAQASSGRGIPSQDSKAKQLERLLTQMVNGTSDAGPTVHNENMPRHLIALASSSADRLHQGTALAALGFLEDSQALPLMLSGAQLQDSFLVDRAVLGLAIKKDPRTPPGVIIAVLDNQALPEESRIQAAWALYVLQQNCLRKDEIPPVWTRTLQNQEQRHPLIVATAVRGLGLTRDPQHAEQVLPFLEHPTAKVRFNAAVALGRMNAQQHYQALLELLGPAETSANVKLAARKALQSLAGGEDHGYDIKRWRHEFERGD